MRKNFNLPLPKETLVNFATKVFTPLKKGQCVTTLWAASSGKTTRLNLLLSEKEILKQIFGENFAKTLFIFIDPDELSELSSAGYLKLLLDRLKEEAVNKKISFPAPKATDLLQIIQDCVTYLLSLDKNLIFILNNFSVLLSFSPTIFVNLEAILSLNKRHISYLFLSHTNLLTEETLFKMDNLKYAVLRNVLYVPIFKDEEIDYFIDKNENDFNLAIPKEVKNLLKKYFGGHPLLLKYSFGFLATLDQNKINSPEYVARVLLDNFELKVATKDIWDALSDKDKEILKYILDTKKLPNVPSEQTKYLLGTGIVKIEGDKATPFGEFFALVIKKELPSYKLEYKVETDDIFVGPVPCADKFTPQEYQVLKFLIKNKDKVVSRDQVAEIIWGKEYCDKYSDWAIDKIFSTIRKKLSILGFSPANLLTLKKRGFKLIS